MPVLNKKESREIILRVYNDDDDLFDQHLEKWGVHKIIID